MSAYPDWMASEAPYLSQLGRDESLWIWRVDGHWIRDHLDVEFTNGHHHRSRRYIPKNEIWIDREARGACESQFWANRQVLEHSLMRSGRAYVSAVITAGRYERAERRRALDDERNDLQDSKRRLLGMLDARSVWLVNGRRVRDLAFVDFTLGGHGYRYRFISKKEIWIDDAVVPAERSAILHHEGIEVGLMARGMPYAEAHAHASRAERAHRCRALLARSSEDQTVLKADRVRVPGHGVR